MVLEAGVEEDSHTRASPHEVLVGNRYYLAVSSLGSTRFNSNCMPRSPLLLNYFLYVPRITRNPISISKFSRDNKALFEFHANKCFVKSHAPNMRLLEGFFEGNGSYCFNNLAFETSPNLTSNSS